MIDACILILRRIIECLLQFHSTYSSVPSPRGFSLGEIIHSFAGEPKYTYTETENKQLLPSNWLTRYYAASQRKAINRFRLVNHISAPTFRVRHSRSIFVVQTYIHTYTRHTLKFATGFRSIRSHVKGTLNHIYSIPVKMTTDNTMRSVTILLAYL